MSDDNGAGSHKFHHRDSEVLVTHGVKTHIRLRQQALHLLQGHIGPEADIPLSTSALLTLLVQPQLAAELPQGLDPPAVDLGILQPG
eukprot:CAMPEP_0181511516 /NCGR_PEP_ID=MMETSP1110-20121109/61473_1 /TAXON_ID=174948 /ORGANISM="Symbiodinium sp., Strain CCMP421" /LENGTH=86 /DNA_ID=CAMNT_0023641253 /DNA_START=99 /DNA_END=359 /DNA_ORIENTATION=+